jgi:hypothetical protein
MIVPEVTAWPESVQAARIRARAAALGRLSDWWPLIAVAVGAATLAILLCVVPDIFVPDTSLGWVDAWYYVSFAMKLPARVAQYGFLYQSDRIAWTLPAYVFDRLASPLLANYLVKAAFFLASVTFLFGSIREITGSVRTAAFVSGLAAFHSFFVHSLGTSYVDGPANAYMFGTLYFGTRAFLRTERLGSAVLAGALVGCQLFTHLASAALFPSLALYFVMTWARAIRSGRDLRRVLVGLCCGLAALVLAVVLLYLHWGTGTLPLAKSIEFIFGHTANGLLDPSSARWIRHALWLLLPTAVAAWAMAAAVRVGDLRWPALLRVPAAFWFLVSVYACWVALYFAKQPWLMVPYYSSSLIPPTFLALGPLSARSLERLSPAAFKSVLVGLFACGGASYWAANPDIVDAAVPAALACLAAATVLRLRWQWHASAAFPVLLITACASINCASVDYAPQLWNGYAETQMADVYRPSRPEARPAGTRAERFEDAVAEAERLRLHLSGNGGRGYFFWYDGDDELGMFYRSVTSQMFAWSTSTLLDEDFHHFDEENRRLLSTFSESGMRDLVVLTRSATLDLPDSRFVVRWTDRERVGDLPYFVHYVAFEPAGADAHR